MTPAQYRAALARLGLSIVGASDLLGISRRTSQRYAAEGVPKIAVPYIKQRLKAARDRLDVIRMSDDDR